MTGESRMRCEIVSTRTRRRKKRGVKLLIAYAIRGAVPLFCIILMICVGFAVKGALADHPEEAQDAVSQEKQIVPSPQAHDTPTPVPAPEPSVQLKDFTVVLDAGHGGTDPGCVQGEIFEKDIALTITMLVKEKLEQNGFAVILTRDADEAVSLSERVALTNQSGADCFVSIHCNMCVEDTSIRGLECYYFRSEEGKKLAEQIIEAVDGASITNNGVIEGNYMVVRDTNIPAVLVETGYLSNPRECEALTTEEYQDVIAGAIVDGIERMWAGTGETPEQGAN